MPQDSGANQNSEPSEAYPEYIRENSAKRFQERNRHHLIINIAQTEDTEKDIECLHKVIDILRNYPGDDEVSFTVVSGDETTNLEMPHITINYCPELVNELNNILGQDGVRVADF